MVRFQVLTAASMKIAVFWVLAPCRSTSETSVNSHKATQRNNPEHSYLYEGYMTVLRNAGSWQNALFYKCCYH
jgi:hypothetical protein